MSRSRLAVLLLVLSVLLPAPGMAQTAPPLVPAPTTKEPYEPGAEIPGAEGAPRGEVIPRQWNRSERSWLTAPRIVLEVLGGFVLGVAGGIPGAALVVMGGFDEGSESESEVYTGLALSFAGLTLGSALGIKAMGSLLDGEGRFLSALAGTTLGGLAGLGLGMVIGWGAGSELWFIPVLAGPLVGGVIAYELSHENALEERSELSRRGVRVIPVVGVSRGGGIIGGLAGRF